MKLHVSRSAVPEGWDDLVRALGGPIFHSSIWAEYGRRDSRNATPHFVTLLSDAGELRGAALVFVEDSPHRLARRLTRTWRTDALPLAAGGVPLPDCVHLLECEARWRGAIAISLNSYASPGGAELSGLGFEVTPRFEFELALQQPEESLWDGMEYKRRKNINKANRMGVVIQDAPLREGIATLRRLQASSSERITARGGPDISRRAGTGGDPVQILLDAQAGKIVVASVGGEPVSAGLFACFNGRVYHLLSGHSGRALETQAPTLLLWETIRRYRGEGMLKLNFGGATADALRPECPEHGVYLYKLAFGGERLECYSGRKVLRARTAAAADFLKSLRHTFGRGRALLTGA
jgi:hypothetical protein